MKRMLVAAMVAGLCLLGAGSAWAVFPGQNGLIAYTDFNGSIHTVLPSGGGDRTIVAPRGFDAAWSPTGERFAFVVPDDSYSLFDIYTMRADGSDERRLTFDSGDGDPTGGNTGGASHPSYSPGGGRIVFGVGGRSLVSQTVTMRTDGSHRRVIARHLGGAQWSPGGEIAFLRSAIEGQQRATIRAMRPDGTHRHRLVSLGLNGGWGPVYSPDGSEFLFVRVRPDGKLHTLLADADGSNVREPPCQALRWMSNPETYSPDGRSVLVSNVNPDGSTVSLVRVSLRSCTGQTVVQSGGDADWQALP
jgi:Tol biopolymer transport system component